jgi:hypothetical protein
VGECECEWVARVPWESAGAGWKRKSVIARWNVECGRAVGECEWVARVQWESVGAWRVRGVRV